MRLTKSWGLSLSKLNINEKEQEVVVFETASKADGLENEMHGDDGDKLGIKSQARMADSSLLCDAEHTTCALIHF